jgi:glutamine synthetase
MHHRRHRRVARGKAMPAAKFGKQTSYFLPNSIFLQTITGEWADNPFDAFTEPDMVLEPDWSTATAAPWTADVTLQVIHDAKDQEGNLIPFPRATCCAGWWSFTPPKAGCPSSRPRWSSS